MNTADKHNTDQSGFSLIELLVAIAIASVILAGLLTSFIVQHKEYQYRGKRVDAVQDMEFGVRLIADDVQAALIGASGTPTVSITDASGNTTDLYTTVWEPNSLVWDNYANMTANNYRLGRHFQYDAANKSLKYDRATDGAGSQAQEMLLNVTAFRVFVDGVTARTGYTDIPSALTPKSVTAPSGTTLTVNGYTILIEIAVDDPKYDKGSKFDVKGNDVSKSADKRKRVWRYVQVYPRTVVN